MPADALTLPAPASAPAAGGERRRAPDRAERRLAARLRAGDSDALAAAYEAYGAATFGLLVAHARRPRRRRGRPAAGLHRGLAARGRLRPAPRRPADVGADHRAQPRDRPPAPARARAARPAAGRRRAPCAADADALLERWRLAQLLGRLPEDERALLRLRFYDELSQSEISAATGIPIGTVKARMVRGLTRLREMIEAEGA